MEYQVYISQKKELYSIIIQFFDCEKGDTDIYFEDLINIIIFQRIRENHKELKIFIKIIIDIFDNHSRTNNLVSKFLKIIDFLKDLIKQTFTNHEIFELSKNNKFLLLLLIKEKIIQIDSTIIESFRSNNFLQYFYPEIKDKIDSDELEEIEKDIKNYGSEIYTNFENIRNCGENETYLCSLIRNDSIEEFVTYMNKTNLPVSTLIKTSPFETNHFLNDLNNISIIQYATFFGSIQIFQYLKFNNAELDSSLWPLAVNSNNAEMIHKLEENHIEPNDKIGLLTESILCHHNAIANYINDSFMDGKPIESNETFLECIFCHYNFDFFPTEINSNFVFYYLFQYDYKMLVQLYLKTKIPKSNNNNRILYHFKFNFIFL